MSPQFVDFDNDGRLDIVAGIFDGSPHVAFGTDKGWKQPEQILDRDGQRIMLNMFWNFDTKKWDETKRCDPRGIVLEKGQCTSAFAFDWDGDGTLDLLLGDYRGGYLFLRRNEGKPGAPKFVTTNEVVMVGDKPLRVPQEMATPRLVDWDGDGRLDLIVGEMGDSFGDGLGGGIYLYRNIGKVGAPQFAEPIVLVERSKKGGDGPTRPDAGLYMDVADVDGDGDLDLVVGGYSMWQPKPPELSAEQRARRDELQRAIEAIDTKAGAVYEAMRKATAGLAEDAADKKMRELMAERQQELAEINGQRSKLHAELQPLTAEARRESYVWLYENLTRSPAAAKK
jgi:hypothetical protein